MSIETKYIYKFSLINLLKPHEMYPRAQVRVPFKRSAFPKGLERTG